MDFKKLSRNLFFAFLFLLPFQTVLLLREPMIDGEKWQYGTIGVYFLDVILVLAFSCFIFSKWKFARENQESRIKNQAEKEGSLIPYSLFPILFIGWSGLSILWAQDAVLAGYFFVKLLLGAGVFFLVRSLDDADMKTAVKVLLAAAVLQSMLAVGQFLYQSSPASALLGMSTHESWWAGTSVLKLETERFLRAYGSFPHPNMLGGFLAAVFVLGISYHISRIRNRESWFSFIICYSSFAILLLGLILTFSRAAWLGAAMGIVAYCVSCIRYHVWGKQRARILGVLALALFMFVFVLRDQIFPRFDGATITREGSVSERIVSLADAKTLIAAHPIIGVGAGNFTKVVMENEPTRPVWSVQPAHNVFALVFAELGVIGLILFVGFLVSVFRSRIFSQKSAILLILLPSLLLDHWFWSSHFGLLFFFLLAGFVARKY